MESLKIAIGSDHAGFVLKSKIVEYLKSKDIQVLDCGVYNKEAADYPVIAKEVVNKLNNNEGFNRAILVCGTGVGMSIVANKFKGIRAVVCSDTFSAKASRAHNNSNVLCLGERVVGECLALDIIDIWLNTSFEAERHQKRIDMIE